MQSFYTKNPGTSPQLWAAAEHQVSQGLGKSRLKEREVRAWPSKKDGLGLAGTRENPDFELLRNVGD